MDRANLEEVCLLSPLQTINGKKILIQSIPCSVFPAGKKFRAVMQLDGVRHNLGMYVTEIEAAQAYDRFARVSIR